MHVRKSFGRVWEKGGIRFGQIVCFSWSYIAATCYYSQRRQAKSMYIRLRRLYALLCVVGSGKINGLG